jgi:rod shape-determining protein MreD
MRYLVVALTAYLAVAFQTTLVEAFQIGRVGPNLPAMVAVAVVLMLRNNGALLLVATIGLLEDALWPGRLGVAMAWHLLIGWGLFEVSERFDLRPLNRRVVATGLCSGLLALGIGTTRLALGEPTLGLMTTWTCAGGIGLYTMAVAVPFWMVLNWSEDALNRRLTRYEI